LAIAWIVAGVVLLAIELHHLAFYALFAAVGCFAGAVTALLFPGAVGAQVIATVLVAAGGIVLVRPSVNKAVTSRRGGHRTRGVHGGLVGQEVVTLDSVGGLDRVGHVQLAGERWRAVSGADVTIPAGRRVLVMSVDGTTLVVWPVDGQLPVEGLDEAEEERADEPPAGGAEKEQP
jgi:membrane protein implicated in regulation of membrane protease activity